MILLIFGSIVKTVNQWCEVQVIIWDRNVQMSWCNTNLWNSKLLECARPSWPGTSKTGRKPSIIQIDGFRSKTFKGSVNPVMFKFHRQTCRQWSSHQNYCSLHHDKEWRSEFKCKENKYHNYCEYYKIQIGYKYWIININKNKWTSVYDMC